MFIRLYVFFLFTLGAVISYGSEDSPDSQPSSVASTESLTPSQPDVGSEAPQEAGEAQEAACYAQYEKSDAYKALLASIKQLGEQERKLLDQIKSLWKAQAHACPDHEQVFLVGTAMEAGLKAGVQILQAKLSDLQGNS